MLVQTLETFFVLLHALLKVFFKLALFGEYRGVVYLLDSLPLTC
jgi:hypothetical protein